MEAAQALMLQANSEEILALSTKLSSPWLSEDYALFRSGEPSFEANEAMKEQIFEVKGISLADILQLANFYEIVLICRERGTCDRETIETYFSPEIGEFACFFAPQIEQIRKRLMRFETLKLVVNEGGGCK